MVRLGTLIAAVAALMLVLVRPAFAKDSPAVELPLRVSAGDRFVVTTEKSRVLSQGGVEGRSPVVVSTFDGEYVEKLSNGYRLRWTLREAKVKDAPGGANAQDLSLMLQGLFAGIAIEVETDERGLPLKVLDMPGTLDRIIVALQKIRGNDEKTAKAVGYVRTLFEKMDERTAALTLFREAVAVSMFQHTALAIGETQSKPAEVANPLGGPNVTLQQSLALQQVDKETGVARFRFTSRLDPASLEASVKAAIDKMIAGLDDPHKRDEAAQAMLAQMRTEKTVTADATVTIEDGWLRTLDMSEEMAITTPQERRTRVDLTRIDIKRVK